MIFHDVSLVFLHISIFLVIAVFFFIFAMKSKSQLHYCFMGLLASLFVWNLGQLLYTYGQFFHSRDLTFFIDVYFLGLDAVPVLFLFLCMIYANTRISLTVKHFLLFIPPLVSYLLLLTNDFHHLIFIRYDMLNSHTIYGKYFLFHTLINYTYIVVGFYYLLSFSIANSGLFSAQSLLICISMFIPFATNILSVFKIIAVPSFATPVMFSASMLIVGWAIIKYRFLNIVPIALSKVLDNMAEALLVVDPDLNIVDFNKSLIRWGNMLRIERNQNLVATLKNHAFLAESEIPVFVALIRDAVTQKKTVYLERHLKIHDQDQYFEFQISPIFSKEEYLGLIFLIKDVTEHQTHLEIIQNTKKLIERERLARLGELAAAVAHDINSPLSAVQTGLFMIDNSIAAGYRQMDEPRQLRQLLDEMREFCGNTINSCQQIVQIVNSIRNHTRNLSAKNIKNFNIDETIQDLKILLNHQLKMSGCELVVSGDSHCLIKGDPGKLSQVFVNLIINSIQAYDQHPGKIEISIENRDSDVLIAVIDDAGGIDEKYAEGIFKNIATTKGEQGTGLGLYISYAIITGHFMGHMWFESQKGIGTTFYISIPNEKNHE